MPLDRRRFLAVSAGLASSLAAAGPAAAQGYGQAFAVTSDEGRPVANMRLPGEITGEIQALRGVTYVGPREAETTLYEFFDFNCPYCRKAAADMASLTASDAALRVGLVHNPILSVQSAQAAKVALAVQRKLGSAAAWTLYGQLLGKPGRIDGQGALAAAGSLGVPAAEIEAIADSEEVRIALKSHMRVAADLGLHATPSYVLGNTGILGHPGAASLARMIAALRRCDRIAC
ncbi:DsbA family protein [Methylobacterium planeticum]|uniref:Thioredoxin domain-containing protein n=1 Tax=Methylobacterium planeticum TaxID=2615211 RepID=A0A6N6MVU4_9HYPH|nr:DsbA family protein [Methylobacterium planeticum]KAB1074836.1 thioredoxin domain-containing protein [Methylobacterium planeticum]